MANLKTANAPLSHAPWNDSTTGGGGPAGGGIRGGGGSGFIRAADLDSDVVAELHRRGLVYFDVPVGPEDRFSIPPLEGFVSNRTPTSSDAAADPLEALLYSVFVASSENLKVRNGPAWLGEAMVHPFTRGIVPLPSTLGLLGLEGRD